MIVIMICSDPQNSRGEARYEDPEVGSHAEQSETASLAETSQGRWAYIDSMSAPVID
jgi:hypothetical protein